MTEREYIIVENLTSIRNAISCLNQALGGDDYGISKEEIQQVFKQLHSMRDKLVAIYNEEQTE